MEDDPFITSPKPPSLTQDEPEGEQPQNLARNSTSQAENNKAKKRRSVTFTEDTRNDAVNNTHPRGKSPVRRETNEVHVSVGDTSSPASAKLTDRRDADVNGARDAGEVVGSSALEQCFVQEKDKEDVAHPSAPKQ
jgi:hypothetical protein